MNKVLIANRGEIARRVIKTLRLMGIKSVAVYSDADANSPHVFEADEAVYLGESPSIKSYLNQKCILDHCKDLGVDAIHPGYGFLSENSVFAKSVMDAGIIFIGPSVHAMDVMGDKLKAKQAVKKFGVPLVPGVDKPVVNAADAKLIAEKIGYPILIKASAGGGGKGMRLVDSANELDLQMRMAQSEARSSFGNDEVFVEKFVSKPRHIEIQVFGDSQGNYVYLFERECSIQRRHQKVVEEAPSVLLTPELRAKMGNAAILVCKACAYVGAGTVEFLLDADLNFYFLEMNTRLQVEHPVTEEITGLDLVEWQIRVARGERLPKLQHEVQMKGHSIEIRVYAEDTFANFSPSIGSLSRYRTPSGKFIRVDDSFIEGMEIPIFYDPMISKLIVWGENREEAVERMIEAIKDYQISGVRTNLDFCTFVLKHNAFRSGDFDTNFVKHYFEDPMVVNDAMPDEAIAIEHCFEQLWNDIKSKKEKEFVSRPIHGAWKLRH